MLFKHIMTLKKALITALPGLFLILDQWLKWQATHGWREPHLTLGGWFGWEPFYNAGIAFSIPVPSVLVIFATIPVMLIMLFSLTRELAGHHQADESSYLYRIQALACIIAGALSNFIDRVQSAFTIDYLRVFTAVINIGDILIVLGFLLYLHSLRKKRIIEE